MLYNVALVVIGRSVKRTRSQTVEYEGKWLTAQNRRGCIHDVKRRSMKEERNLLQREKKKQEVQFINQCGKRKKKAKTSPLIQD